MARTDLAVQPVVVSGLAAVYTAANVDGHSIDNKPGMVLHVKNGSGVSINVTCQTPATVGSLAVAEDIVAVAAGAEKFIGPFDPGLFNQAGGDVYVDFSAVTTVTVAALQVNP